MDAVIDYKERLLKDFEDRLSTVVPHNEVDKISSVLLMTLADYHVEKESRELIVLDDYNDRVLNTYSNCLLIEGKSEKTVKQYRRELNKIGSVINKKFCDMTTYDLRYYLATLKSRGVTNTTLENSRSYMSAFFKWMEVEGFIMKNPMSPIKSIKTNPKEETPFLGSEIDALRFACQNTKERALIETALSSGLRCEELARLRISDIDLKSLEVHVRQGKGNKKRVSYINELTAKCIEKYLIERKDNLDILFLSRNNGGDFFTESGIYSIIVGVGDRAKVDSVHPHRFRHTMASNLAEKGMPIHEIKELLGHTNVNTTMRYVHTTSTIVKASYRKFSG